MITTERLRQVLDYDPATGLFKFTKAIKKAPKDRPAGCIDKSTGYRVIRVDGVLYYAHRLAWQYMTGEVPATEIDHKNTVKTDNWFENLRPASRGQNENNKDAPCNNTSGVKGVSFCRLKGKWRAYITIDKRRVSLGYHDEKSDAVAARVKAAKNLQGDFYRMEAHNDNRCPAQEKRAI